MSEWGKRVTGIEPVTAAWKAEMLPLHHAREDAEKCPRRTRHLVYFGYDGPEITWKSRIFPAHPTPQPGFEPGTK